jgi:hypothetical protein
MSAWSARRQRRRRGRGSVAHPKTHGGRQRNALNTSSYFPACRRCQRNTLDTSSFFLFRNKAATFAAKGEEEEEKRQTEVGSSGSSTGRKRARSRSGSNIKAGSKGSKGSSKDSTASRVDRFSGRHSAK